MHIDVAHGSGVWADEANTLINCRITPDWLGIEVPFTAGAGDPEAHGRQIFAAFLAGEHGAIAPYVPPPKKA